MKTHLLYLLSLFITTISIAQNGFNYKALIKDNNGNIIADQSITIQFEILENGTNSVFQETHNPTTDANGIVNVNIGEGSPLSGIFELIDWASEDHFLNVKIDTGSGLEDLGTSQFKSVPYAIYAESAGDIGSNNIIDLKYPDGFKNIEPVRFRNPFTVPFGQNLYITHYYSETETDINITTSYILTIGGGLQSNMGYQSLTQPLIIGTGETVGPANTTMQCFGFLVDAKVTPVVSPPLGTYTVPNGKFLVITNTTSNIKFENGFSNSINIYKGNGNLENNSPGQSSFFNPIILAQGEDIDAGTWTGYLINN